MTVRPTAVILGLVAALAVAGGATWAIAKDDARAPWPAPTSDVLAVGAGPSNNAYEIKRIDPNSVGADPSEAFCFEIRTTEGETQIGRTQGCDIAAHALDGRELRPSYTLLATDRFFTLLAPEGVETMAVTVRGGSPTTTATSEAIDAGEAGKLLVAMVGGPTVTSRDPASFQDYEVRLLDANGEVVHEMETGDGR